jgi:acylphosphatase
VIRRRVVIRGRVQGVGFRYSLARAAETRGVAGWVRTLPDGVVEAVFEGEREPVEAMLRLSSDGPRGAAVEQVEAAEEEPDGLRGFDIR